MMPSSQSTIAPEKKSDAPSDETAVAITATLIAEFKEQKDLSKTQLDTLQGCLPEERNIVQFDDITASFHRTFLLMGVGSETAHQDAHQRAVQKLSKKPTLGELQHISGQLLIELSGRNWIFSDLGRLSTELSELNTKIKTTSDCLSESLECQAIQLAKCEQKIIKLTEELSAHKEQAAGESGQLRSELSDLKAAHEALIERATQLESLVEKNAECHKEMAAGLEELKQREIVADEALADKDQKISNLEEQVQGLSTQVADLTTQIQSLQEQLLKTITEKTGFEEQVGVLRARELEKNAQHVTTISALKKQLASAIAASDAREVQFGQRSRESTTTCQALEDKVKALEAALELSNANRREMTAQMFSPGFTGQGSRPFTDEPQGHPQSGKGKKDKRLSHAVK